MPSFKYRAKDQTGNTVDGVIEAATSEEAVEKVSQLGQLPIHIEETHSADPKAAAHRSGGASRSAQMAVVKSKIKSKEITIFGRELSSLIRAGVPILRAIEIVKEQSENLHFQGMLEQVHAEIKNGAHLSAALAQFPKQFPPLYLALIAAGETSGTLDQALARITDFRQKQEEIVSRIRTAMIYPAMMAVTGAGTIVFMLTFVMPRLIGVFSNLGGDLPLPTRILIQISDFLRQGWVWVAVAIIALGVGVLMRRTKSGQNLPLSAFTLRIPVLGTFILKAEIARFSMTLELLIKSGIPILQAIESAAPVLSNAVLKVEVLKSVQGIREGGSFGRSLKSSKLFPVFFTNLITVGEESGKLDEALAEVASFYERATNEALQTLTSLLEPLMILVMGLVVGFIVVAMLLPMFELNMMVK